jgi:hypothetical protein
MDMPAPESKQWHSNSMNLNGIRQIVSKQQYTATVTVQAE